MASAAPQKFTPAEYLALERASETKHEFVEGRIIAMASARPPHNMLAVNLSAALLAPGRAAGCAVLSSDQRVHVPATGLYAYPDVTLACGQRRYTDDDPPSLLNPTLIVEVTSDSSEEYDRGTKFLHYQAIESLSEYVIVSHRERRVDHYRRLESGQWLLTSHTRDDSAIELSAVAGTVRLGELYAGIDLDEGR